MKVIPLHEKATKLCFRSTGDVVSLPEDGSGPYIVGHCYALKPGNSSGLFEHGIDHVHLIHLQTGVMVPKHLSTRVVHYPNAEVHTLKGEL